MVCEDFWGYECKRVDWVILTCILKFWGIMLVMSGDGGLTSLRSAENWDSGIIFVYSKVDCRFRVMV